MSDKACIFDTVSARTLCGDLPSRLHSVFDPLLTMTMGRGMAWLLVAKDSRQYTNQVDTSIRLVL